MNDSMGMEKSKPESESRLNGAEKVELLPEGPAGVVMQAVRDAKPGDIVYLSGFEAMEYEEIKNMLEDRDKGFSIHIQSDTDAVANAKDASREGREHIVVRRENLLAEMFSHAPEIEPLTHPSNDPQAELSQWLGQKAEKAKEDSSASPEQMVATVIKNIRGMGTTTFVMRPSSPLAVMLVAYAMGKFSSNELEPIAIDPTLPLTIKIASSGLTVISGGTQIGSRSIN